MYSHYFSLVKRSSLLLSISLLIGNDPFPRFRIIEVAIEVGVPKSP